MKLLADGGGVESPSDDAVRGDITGDDRPGDKLISSNCNGRGPAVGEDPVGVAGATALMIFWTRVMTDYCADYILGRKERNVRTLRSFVYRR